MKTIGILLGSLAGAGAEKSLLTLATTLAEKGHKVYLVLLKGVFDFDVPNNIEVVVLTEDKMQQLTSVTTSIAFDLFVCSRVECYSHVRCSNTWGFVCITPTALIDTPWWNFYKRYRDKKKWRKYLGKNLIAVSKGIASDLIDNIGVDPQRVKVIYDAYDFNEITELAKQPIEVPKQPYALCVGALKKRKGQHLLLRAFARIADKKLHLLFIGKGEDEYALKQLAQKLGIAHRVEFVGWTSNPYPYIAHAKLSLLASSAEGLPRVVVESLFLGIPVVATNCRSGPNEVLTEKLANYLVPVGDYMAIAEAIDMALADYPKISATVTQRFNAIFTAEQYERLAEVP